MGGDKDWIVDVVLRADGDADSEDRVVTAVAESLHLVGSDRAPTPTYSFDISPPDGSIGVSCWLEADSASEAADAGLRLVSDAARTITGKQLALWDLRVVPGAAVFERSDAAAR